jgi:hypothetical protein
MLPLLQLLHKTLPLMVPAPAMEMFLIQLVIWK